MVYACKSAVGFCTVCKCSCRVQE